MNSTNKINVLVIPDLFPKFKGDVQGIFVLDYLTSTSSYCNNNVLFGRLTSDKKGTSIVNNDDYDLYRFSMSSKKVPFYLKPFYYFFAYTVHFLDMSVFSHFMKCGIFTYKCEKSFKFTTPEFCENNNAHTVENICFTLFPFAVTRFPPIMLTSLITGRYSLYTESPRKHEAYQVLCFIHAP